MFKKWYPILISFQLNLRIFRIHYIEYLVRKIRETQLEPLPLLNIDDLETCVKRTGIKLPPNWYGRNPEHYKRDLLEVNEKASCMARLNSGYFSPQAALHWVLGGPGTEGQTGSRGDLWLERCQARAAPSGKSSPCEGPGNVRAGLSRGVHSGD